MIYVFSRNVTEDSLPELRELMASFVIEFEELYALHDGDPERTRLMTSYLHGLLHMTLHIRIIGSDAV